MKATKKQGWSQEGDVRNDIFGSLWKLTKDLHTQVAVTRARLPVRTVPLRCLDLPCPTCSSPAAAAK